MVLNLRPLRERQGLSKLAVAKAMGVAYPSYLAWETGKALPTADKLPALAEVLGSTVDALYCAPPGDNSLPEEGGEIHGA